MGFLLISLLIPLAAATYIENVAANVDSSSSSRRHEKFVPMVAFECGYRNKYLGENGVWQTDENRYATCQSGKLDILKYCKKAYPKLNITNLVEYSHEVDLPDWCKEEGSPCQWTHIVRPYQCIEGEFRSEALQVPHDCKFSHLNSKSTCDDYQHWRDQAKKNCASKKFDGKDMAMRSFAVLEPCGLDLFTGVEFVCCPAGDKQASQDNVIEHVAPVQKVKALPTDDDEDDDEYDDDYTESDEDEVIPEEEGQDPYFKKVDPANEHDLFGDAIERLDSKHRRKVDVVMKEWSELEARYNKMKEKDPKKAKQFKVAMSNRFQKTVASLEEEHKRQKQEVERVHEERVQSALNERKRTATHEYRHALAEYNFGSNKPQVLKTLKSYIRAEEKDRTHTLNKYRHLLRTDKDEATKYKEVVFHKLRYIDLRINGTMAMLRDFPDLEKQVAPIALEYWADFRRENTPELSDETIAALNTLDADAKNKRLVNLYQEAYEKLHPSMKLDVRAPPSTTTQKAAEPTPAPVKILPDDSSDSEEEDDEYYEDEDDEQVKKTENKAPVIDIKVKAKTIKTFDTKATQTDDVSEDSDSESDSDSAEDDIIDEEQLKELKVDIEPIIEEKPSLYRREKLVQHQRNTSSAASDISSQVLFMFGGIFMVAASLMVVSFIRRRRSHHGFIEVDVYTPEERHVSGMQVNGYENPTYSFFDSKA